MKTKTKTKLAVDGLVLILLLSFAVMPTAAMLGESTKIPPGDIEDVGNLILSEADNLARSEGQGLSWAQQVLDKMRDYVPFDSFGYNMRELGNSIADACSSVIDKTGDLTSSVASGIQSLVHEASEVAMSTSSMFSDYIILPTGEAIKNSVGYIVDVADIAEDLSVSVGHDVYNLMDQSSAVLINAVNDVVVPLTIPQGMNSWVVVDNDAPFVAEVTANTINVGSSIATSPTTWAAAIAIPAAIFGLKKGLCWYYGPDSLKCAAVDATIDTAVGYFLGK